MGGHYYHGQDEDGEEELKSSSSGTNKHMFFSPLSMFPKQTPKAKPFDRQEESGGEHSLTEALT